MRTWFPLILLAAFLLALPACEPFGINNSSDGVSRDSVRQAYYEDAQQLAVRRMVAEDDSSVEIPDDRVQPFYNALLAVYNATGNSARNSIVGIHTFPRYNLHEISVGVDSTVAWTAAWQDRRRLTGNETVDALLEKYDLSLAKYWNFIASALLRSDSPINPVTLSAKFDGISGVRYAETNGTIGDGNDIQAEVIDEAILLHYSRGWGDCPAGCIHRKTWTFRVEASGQVTFEGVSTD